MGLVTRIRGMLSAESEETETVSYRCRTCQATFEVPASDQTGVACTSCGSDNVELR